MSNGTRREIPGYYFDPEKKRYFLIPKSGSGAHVQGTAVQKLDDKVKHEKRKKNQSVQNAKKKMLPISNHELELINQSNAQKQFYEHLEEQYFRTKKTGLTNPMLKKLLDRHYSYINKTRPIQMLESVKTLDIGMAVSGVIKGMRLCFQSDTDANFINFYDDQHIMNGVAFKSNISTLPGLESIDSYYNDFFISHDDSKVKGRYVLGVNGSVRLFNDSGSYRNSISEYILDDEKYCKYIRRDNGLYIGRECIKLASEMTCIFGLKGIVAYGCRNGKVYLIFNSFPDYVIEFGVPICSVILLEIENNMFCVVSGTNNILRSYIIDRKNRSAKLSMIYDDYIWDDRLSNNMKYDKFASDTFCIESRSSQAGVLELKFYSIYCHKPLKIVTNPFLIRDSFDSDMSWFIYKMNLVILQRREQSIKIYRPLLHRAHLLDIEKSFD